MKEIIVTYRPHDTVEHGQVTDGIRHVVFKGDGVDVSDGYHSIDELYDHRITLWIVLCRFLRMKGAPIYRAKQHADGSEFEGWFVLGLDEIPGRQITYHLPIARWDECNFAVTYERAPEWDKHTPADVLARLKDL